MQPTSHGALSPMVSRYEAMFSGPGGAELFVDPPVPVGAWLVALSSVGVQSQGVGIAEAYCEPIKSVPIEELKVFVNFQAVVEGGDFSQRLGVVWHEDRSFGIPLTRAVVETLRAIVCIPSGDLDAEGFEEALLAFPSDSSIQLAFRLRDVVHDGTVTWALATVVESEEGDEFRLAR